uniref:Uncharacterized protein n=1 Tax=Avena sativa TaxID=4498 RepID=A0ACD6ANC2_AVESA
MLPNTPSNGRDAPKSNSTWQALPFATAPLLRDLAAATRLPPTAAPLPRPASTHSPPRPKRSGRSEFSCVPPALSPKPTRSPTCSAAAAGEMGGARSQVNKAHKTRFASKASRHSHKIDKVRSGKAEGSHRATVKGARNARVQRSKAIRDQKRAALLKEKRSSSGSSSAPRVIVLCGLSSSANVGPLAEDLLTFAAGGDEKLTSSTVASPTYKLRTTVLQAPYGDLASCMELAKVADLLAFVVSANSLCNSDSSSPIDEFGEQCLSVFRAMGLPSTAVLIRDLPSDTKSRQELKKAVVSFVSPELPEDSKFYPAENKEDLHTFMRLFKEQHLSSPHWRNQRPYVMSEEAVMTSYTLYLFHHRVVNCYVVAT